VPKTRRHSLPAGELRRGRGSHAGSTRRPPGLMCSAVAVCHASGSALMNRSAGRSVWPKKNQWYPARREPGIAPGQRLADGDGLHQAQAAHRARMARSAAGRRTNRDLVRRHWICRARGLPSGRCNHRPRRAWSRVDGRVSSAASTIRRIRAGQDSCTTCPARPRRSASPSQARTPSASRPTMRTPRSPRTPTRQHVTEDDIATLMPYGRIPASTSRRCESTESRVHPRRTRPGRRGTPARLHRLERPGTAAGATRVESSAPRRTA